MREISISYGQLLKATALVVGHVKGIFCVTQRVYFGTAALSYRPRCWACAVSVLKAELCKCGTAQALYRKMDTL